MPKLLETLKTLSHIATQVRLFAEIARETYESGDILDSFVQLPDWYAGHRYSKMVLSMSLNEIMVFANSYLDELQQELIPNKHPKHRHKILPFLKVVRPALKRIRKWTHLKEYRNEVLVHNYRVKNVSIFSKGYKKKEYKVPSKDREILLLAELIFLINRQLFVFFPDEVQDMLEENERINDKYAVIDEEINFWEEIDLVTREVELLKEAVLGETNG